MEEQKKNYIGISDTSQEIIVSYGRTSSSEISNQSIAKLYVNSVEGGPELIDCNVNIRLMPGNDDNNGINKDLDESSITFQTKKRKMEELSDLPTTDLVLRQDACSSSLLNINQRAESTALDQPVEVESVSPCCSASISDKWVIAVDEISVEVDEKKSLEEGLCCTMGIQTSSNHDGVLIVKSDETIKSQNFNMLPNNNHKELDAENKDTVTIEDVHNLEFGAEDIGICPRLPSDDAVGADASLCHEEQSVASEVDLSLELLDGAKGVASQVAHEESINVAMDRTFAGYNGKKLLVLDVNGLLVYISPYVPYDFDPDDIILKKAVYKRPHCDDFMKFCFERFNVGVWTSRTKYNIEPILDFLLGNDRHKLLFCWDQSHCTNTGFTTVEKRHKPLLLKKLKKLWNKCDPNLPWEKGVYNESNTLLLDDTPYKALTNPRYTAVFPFTYHFKDVGDNSLGPGGDLRVYLEGLAVADDVREYVKQNPFGQRAITEKNLSWGYYRKVIEASSTPPRETDNNPTAPSAPTAHTAHTVAAPSPWVLDSGATQRNNGEWVLSTADGMHESMNGNSSPAATSARSLMTKRRLYLSDQGAALKKQQVGNMKGGVVPSLVGCMKTTSVGSEAKYYNMPKGLCSKHVARNVERKLTTRVGLEEVDGPVEESPSSGQDTSRKIAFEVEENSVVGEMMAVENVIDEVAKNQVEEGRQEPTCLEEVNPASTQEEERKAAVEVEDLIASEREICEVPIEIGVESFSKYIDEMDTVPAFDSSKPPPLKQCSVHNNWPFEKTAVLWQTIESIEALQRLPQNPHFQPLEQENIALREGLAIGHMVNFSNLVKQTSKLQVSDPKSSMDEIMAALPVLETHGFDVSVVRERVTELLIVKDGEEKLLDEANNLKDQISVQRREVDWIVEKMRENREEIRKLEEKLLLLESAEAKLDEEIASLQAGVEETERKMKNGRAGLKVML